MIMSSKEQDLWMRRNDNPPIVGRQTEDGMGINCRQSNGQDSRGVGYFLIAFRYIREDVSLGFS